MGAHVARALDYGGPVGSTATVLAAFVTTRTYEDSLTIDRKYREPWTGRLPTRFVVRTNELAALRARDARLGLGESSEMVA